MDYHVGRGAQQLGTFSEEQIREGLKCGNFQSSDLVWAEGMSEWQPLNSLAPFQVTSVPTLPTPMPGAIPFTQVTVLPPGAPVGYSGMAVTSLVCGILGITMGFCCGLFWFATPAAIIFGHIALSEIKRNPRLDSSRGLAITGLILGYLGIAVVVVLILIYGVAIIAAAATQKLSDTH